MFIDVLPVQVAAVRQLASYSSEDVGREHGSMSSVTSGNIQLIWDDKETQYILEI